ncbi:MAG: carboxylating nicotinate-nucleotide diphosphorylase [Candidatus Omnitrophota bacterium]
MRINRTDLRAFLKNALAEDIGPGDITTGSMVRRTARTSAQLIMREGGVLCGLPVLREIFLLLDRDVRVIVQHREGTRVKSATIIATLEGPARAIFAGERLALNILGRLSGIATLTSRYVAAVGVGGAVILDTRKTTPGLRALEKYAVVIGGGRNHRKGLWDQVLVKDNHIALWRTQTSAHTTSLRDLVEHIRANAGKGIKIEIEVENLHEFKDAITAHPDIILLDNMPRAAIKSAVSFRNQLAAERRQPITKLEASGGITLKNVRAVSRTGVDMISIGALTHSARSLDFSLEVAR